MATSTAHPQANTRFPTSLWKPFAVVLPFLLLFWINIAHHTMFFDEVNAWAISAASPTLSKLFYYVHFEGHPWLWYFILWFPSRLTHDPVAMKWVEAAFGTAILLIIGMLSPFTWKQRVLILSGYFLLWEYTVMCRMYSVMLLLVLLYVVRRVRRPEGVVGCCALLGLAGNTDMSGMLLATALLIEYAYSSYFGVPKQQRIDVVKRWIPGLLVYVALVGLAVATLWPSKEISWQSSGHMGAEALNRHHINAAIGNMIASPWWPISPQFPHRFWETSVVDAHWLYYLMPFVLFVYWITFRRDRNLLLLMACTLLFGALFADVVYVGRPRHWGIAFVSFLIGLWIQGARDRRNNQRPAWSPWTYGLLAVSALAGVVAIVSSWHRPFSRAREAATWIERNEPGVAVTGMPDVSFGSLAAELQQPEYYPECDCIAPFKLFSKHAEDYNEGDYARALNGAMNAYGTNSLVFAHFIPLQPDDIKQIEDAGMSIKPVAAFPFADMVSESFFLYDVRKNQ